MQATQALRFAMAELLAADSATLAPASSGNKVHLVKEPFTPSEATDINSVTLADFDGSTALVCGTGTQPSGFDPNTNDGLISLKPPSGGFRWETTGTTNLPQTIYGYVLTDNAGAVLMASALLPTPIVLTATNQEVQIGAPQLRELAGCLQ